MKCTTKVLFFDIDGTLINFAGVMPRSAQDALKRHGRTGIRLFCVPEEVNARFTNG